MPDKDEIAVFLSVAAIAIYFMGFNYILEFFRYFGIGFGYRFFDLPQMAFHSFSVVYALITFDDLLSSLIVVALLVVVGGLFYGNHWRDLLVKLRVGGLAKPVRWLLAGGLTMFVLYFTAGRIGHEHACYKSTHDTVNVVLNDPQVGPETIAGFAAQTPLIMLWQTDDEVFLSEHRTSCVAANENDRVRSFIISKSKIDSIELEKPPRS